MIRVKIDPNARTKRVKNNYEYMTIILNYLCLLCERIYQS